MEERVKRKKCFILNNILQEKSHHLRSILHLFATSALTLCQITKFFTLSKLKAFCRPQNNYSYVTQMFLFVFHNIEDIVGKGEKLRNQNFLLFPLCFQKAFC